MNLSLSTARSKHEATMPGNLHQLSVDSLAILRRFSPYALLAALAATALFLLVLDLWAPLSLLLGAGVYLGVTLLIGKTAETPPVVVEPLSPDEEAFVRAREDTARVLGLAQQIDDESMRGRVEAIGQTFGRMLDVMQEDRNFSLAPDYEAVIVEPFSKKLAYYVRLTNREIDLANPQLVRFEQVDVPRNEAVARKFYQRYHDGDVMDLAALLETFWDEADDDDDSELVHIITDDDPEMRL